MKKFHYEYIHDNTYMPALLEGTLFLDIETTGFSRTSTYLTIIGLAWQDNDKIVIEQWFNDQGRQEEPLLLIELERFFKTFHTFPTLIHYNGTTFDIPYLTAKYEQYHLPTSLSYCTSVDLYQLSKKYKNFLGLTGIKQKNLEEFFGLYREDTLSGQELIDTYMEGIASGHTTLLNAYLLHNKEDMEGMVFLQHLLKIHSFFTGSFNIVQWDIIPADSLEKESLLRIILEGNYYLHQPIQCSCSGILLSMTGGQTELSVPVCSKEVKYFYPNYKDYYYLPSEDCAMHKSVAEYVEKEYRKKATKETCYTKKQGDFIPLFLPSAARLRKLCLKDCCLDLFYETYGDSIAWVNCGIHTEKEKHAYVSMLLKTILEREK